ncbi:EVE domain-containing protein [Herpetosiphon giganteus]|uniref:EVE domain-containing protein n=1 Tax=Herpetosiphon giganteus TaxID=2029754 RepID=UPI00195DF06B|nr:EVE domain-containing protein [Herpetosiphon giganteus]MBM7843675.1 putative RNA-binding protein with PUA-like domain [Herpetosiphon giganteus]
MAYWLLKTEPNEFSWDDLVRDGSTVWNGVTNAQALINLRAMQLDDQCLIYHSGDVRAAVGIAQVSRSAYPDPTSENPKHVVVEIEPVVALKQAVTLAQIKAEPSLADWMLVRQSRLSVVACSPEQWAWIIDQAAR